MSSTIAVPVAQLRNAIAAYDAWLKETEGNELGEGLIACREGIDRLEAAFAGGLHRFDRSGEYRADGALSAIAWLRWKCRLSGGAAAERVGIARQLPQLPRPGKLSARASWVISTWPCWPAPSRTSEPRQSASMKPA